MAHSAADARALALSVLNRLDRRRRTLDALMEEMDHRERLDPRDRAFLNTLVYGVLRWRGRLDWTIGRFSKIPLKKVDPRVLNILRLGLYQIRYLDRVPASAAVNTSVEMAKKVTAPWVVKFVNALLRKMATAQEPAPSARGGEAIVPILSAEKSMPEWLMARWVGRFGETEAAALCDAINTVAAITVRTNTLRTRREALMEELAPFAEPIRATPHSPDGISFAGGVIGQMPAFTAGRFQVQDEAAQLVTRLTAPRPGDTVLDACAGLGGKTGGLAQLMENRGKILAVDINGGKLDRLTLEMKRLGITIVETRRADLSSSGADTAPLGQFDRVLLDAPCSGAGVLGKNPDTKWSLSEKDLARCRARQERLLHRVSPLVKPGGILAYVVCSMEPEENEMVAADFLDRHPAFSPALPPCPPALARRFLTPEGYFRSLPHRDGMDGFFGAYFRRDG